MYKFLFLFRGLLGNMVARGYGSLKPLREAFEALAYVSLQFQAKVQLTTFAVFQLYVKRSLSRDVIMHKVRIFSAPVFVALRRTFNTIFRKNNVFEVVTYASLTWQQQSLFMKSRSFTQAVTISPLRTRTTHALRISSQQTFIKTAQHGVVLVELNNGR